MTHVIELRSTTIFPHTHSTLVLPSVGHDLHLMKQPESLFLKGLGYSLAPMDRVGNFSLTLISSHANTL